MQTIFKGVVRNNVVIVENAIQLPEGAAVEVHLLPSPADREAAFRRVLENPIQHYVGIDEIIEEEKQERENRRNP